MVYIFLANGFEDIEAVAPFDILQRAGLKVKTVGVGGKNIKSAHGLSVIADMEERDFTFSDIDAIIFPGGMPGATNLKKSIVVEKAVKSALNSNILIGAICAAPGVVLNGTGALDDKRYTCFPGFEVEEGNYTAAKVEHDGNLITANGPGAAADFAVEIADALCKNGNIDSLKRDFC